MQSLPAAPPIEGPDIGQRLRALRLARGLSLAQLAAQSGISDATLSRVETGKSLTSAHNLYTLSRVLDVDITAFFDAEAHPLRAGIRSVSRAGEGGVVPTEKFLTRVLASDLARKRMHPAINTVTARSLDEAGGLASHPGEEFLYVISGQLVLHTAHYAPTLLGPGDTIYFDGSMPHAYAASGEGPAECLVINTVNAHSGTGDASSD